GPGNVELARTIKMHGAGRSRRQGAMPEQHEFATALIARRRFGKDFFGFQIKKAQAHGAVAHDSFEVAHTAATAKLLLRIERDNRMAPFTDARDIRIAT